MNDENGQVYLKAGNCAVTHLRHLGKAKVMLCDAEAKFVCYLRSEQRFHRVQIKRFIAVKKVNAFIIRLHLNVHGIFWLACKLV